MIAAKERPILFSGPMVRAILEGRKTQTRRVVKIKADGIEPPETYAGEWQPWKNGERLPTITCPYGEPPDRLWVRESWTPIPAMKPSGYFTDPKWVNRTCWYAADNDRPTWGGKWRPSIHMPRSESRITLEVTDVRVERLREITPGDAQREGVEGYAKQHNLGGYWTTAFARLWDVLNGPRGFAWASNPWVWVVQFKVIPPEEGSGRQSS